MYIYRIVVKLSLCVWMYVIISRCCKWIVGGLSLSGWFVNTPKQLAMLLDHSKHHTISFSRHYKCAYTRMYRVSHKYVCIYMVAAVTNTAANANEQHPKQCIHIPRFCWHTLTWLFNALIGTFAPQLKGHIISMFCCSFGRNLLWGTVYECDTQADCML